MGQQSSNTGEIRRKNMVCQINGQHKKLNMHPQVDKLCDQGKRQTSQVP